MTDETAWVCGYLLEFADGGPVERIIVRKGGRAQVERTAARLEQIGEVPYTGDRPVSHGIVFDCAADQIDDTPA